MQCVLQWFSLVFAYFFFVSITHTRAHGYLAGLQHTYAVYVNSLYSTEIKQQPNKTE